jgi:hypothetical protein
MDVRKTPDAMVFALMAQQKARMIAEAKANHFHLQAMTDPGPDDYQNPTETLVQVTSANATNEATSVTLVNELKAKINRHFVDAVAHDAALSDEVTTDDATNAATAIVLANDLKAAWNDHLDEADVHYNDDTTNEATNNDATDQATLNTLVNELKGHVNAHVADAPPGPFLNLVPA